MAAFQALWCQQMLCGHSAQPHVLMQAFVVKILPWWRTGSSNALEREEKIFFLEPNRRVFSCHCLPCMLDSGVHSWHKNLRRSRSANYRNLLKCRPFPLRKVAFGDDCLSWDAFLGKHYYCYYYYWCLEHWDRFIPCSNDWNCNLSWHWDAFLPETRGAGREKPSSQRLG